MRANNAVRVALFHLLALLPFECPLSGRGVDRERKKRIEISRPAPACWRLGIRGAGLHAIVLPCMLLAGPAANAQISFYTAIDQALRNSPKVRMNVADVQRAQAGVMETKDAYKPSLLLGSSIGFSYGFPLGQPEVFSLTGQSLVLSFSQPDYIRSARRALESAQLHLKDTRQQVILDTALEYIELAKVEQQNTALGQESGYVLRLIDIEEQRVDAGRDSRVELTRARLTGAQVALKRLQLMNQGEMLRAELAHLTGLHSTDINPELQTIPAAPAVQERADTIDSTVKSANSGVQAAYAEAASKLYTAFGDSRQNNRPTIAFVASYGLFSNINNYAQYYLHFQENNFGAGVQISIPLLDAARKAKARGSVAEAARAAAEADELLDQTGEQVLQLQKNLTELAAQEQVVELESELAQDQLNTVRTELQSGNGNLREVQLTPKDEQQALVNERSRYVDLLDARFQVTQAQLNLLRSLGRIEDWAKSSPRE
jgi:outer membrane protein TolC